MGAANRKVYMSYEIEPAKEITGGAWCVWLFQGCAADMAQCIV